MSIRSIRNGMYPVRVPQLPPSKKSEKSKKAAKPTASYMEIRSRMRRQIGWE